MERQKIPPRESYLQTPRKRAFKTKESPLHTTPKEIKQASNCSCLTAREGGRRRVREGEADEADKTGRSRNARCSDLPLRGRQNEEVDIEFLRCSRALCEPLVGAGLLRNSGRCSSFWLNLHRSLLRLPPSRRPCRFFAAFVLRTNALAAGQGGAMGSSRPTPGGDVLERFGRQDESRKRRLRQTESEQMRLRRRRLVARGRRPSREAVARGRADTRTRASAGVVGVRKTSYATTRFAQAWQAKRSLLSTRESRNDHRSVRVGRCVGHHFSACAAAFCGTVRHSFISPLSL